MRPINFFVATTSLIGIITPTMHAIARTCYIYDPSTLANCINEQPNYTTLKLMNNLACGDNNCCTPNGHLNELISLKEGTVFNGSGHKITRNSSQKTCPLFAAFNASNITIKNLIIDENIKTPPCEPSEIANDCTNTIYFHSITNGLIDNVKIHHGKGIVVKAWGVKEFVFSNSAISNAGVIGLLIGDKLWSQSENISVINSTFTGVRTNALAVTGAEGRNFISNNTFNENHYHGLWGNLDAPANGGQLYISSAKNLIINDNIFFNGICENCRNSSVWAIEIAGVPNSGYNVYNLKVNNNLIFNSKTLALFHNNPSSINNTLAIENNKIYGGHKLSNFDHSPALFRKNIINNKKHHESSNH